MCMNIVQTKFNGINYCGQEVQQRFDCTDEVCLLVHFCRFEFTWPAHSIVITPERGEVPPRY